MPGSTRQARELGELAFAEHPGRREARARLSHASDRLVAERRHESLELDEARLERPLVVVGKANADDHGLRALGGHGSGFGDASNENSSIVWWSMLMKRETRVDLLASMICAP